MTAIVWFRRDLRVHDHPPLTAALAVDDVVIPVFCLDRRLRDGRHRSAARDAFLRACLRDLDATLRQLGSGLVVLDGRPEQVLGELAAQVDARKVFACEDVSPFARSRDTAVAAALRKSGAELALMPGSFVIDDFDGTRTGSGNPYTVFTPFYRRWLQQPRRAPEPAPVALPALPACVKVRRHAAMEQRSENRFWPGSERAARERLSAFLDLVIDRYGERHDTVGAAGTSELSPYLHMGCLSPREFESKLPDSDGGEAVRRQLCWRDFYAYVLWHNPGNARNEHQLRYRGRIHWSDQRDHFNAWCEGYTGYPLVDAGMRQLAQTGWMHNRARMVVGSFLVKDLGIDWRWGERWFMQTLIDGDEASNNGNWQWIASVGVDTQPPSRRIYNPTLQQRRFDPDGAYVRRWVPELELVPDEFLCEPWKMPTHLQAELGCVIGAQYPAPLVDHAAARRSAISRYAAARGD